MKNQVKVTNVQMHATTYGKVVPVVEATVMLIEPTREQKVEFYGLESYKGKLPIFISTEKIADNDEYVYSLSFGKMETKSGDCHPDYWRKVLATPSNLSDRQTDAINNDKVKHGTKVLIECEVITITSGSTKKQLVENTTKEYRIKFTGGNRITFYPADTKQLDNNKMYKVANLAYWKGANDKADGRFLGDTTFNAWFEEQLFRLASNAKFTQTISMEAIYEKCMKDYKEKGDDNTISTTGVPFTKIGTYGIYSVSVRYCRLFNQKPAWGYSLDCGGGASAGGFKTLPEAIEACVACGEQKEMDFYKRHPQLAEQQ